MPTIVYPEIESPYGLTSDTNTNWITGEVHNLVNTNALRIVRPNYGSFFKDELVVNQVNSNGSLTPLVLDTDYKLIQLERAASEKKGYFIYQYIQISNSNVSSVSLNLHVVGGVYQDPATTLVQLYQLLQDRQSVLGSTSFSQISDLPSTFPGAPNPIDMQNTHNWERFIDAINQLGQAIQLGNNAYLSQLLVELRNKWLADINDLEAAISGANTHAEQTGNVHGMNKTQIDLGNVANLPIANSADLPTLVGGAPISNANNKYVTLQTLQAYHEQYVRPLTP